MTNSNRDAYRSWLVGELTLVGALAMGTIVAAATGALRGYDLPGARMSLETAFAVIAAIVAILAAVRFRVEGRALDLLLAVGFFVAGPGAFALGQGAALAEATPSTRAAGAGLAAALLAAALIAAAPFVRLRVTNRRRGFLLAVVFVAGALVLAWAAPRLLIGDGWVGRRETVILTLAYAVLTVLALVAAVGFGLRFRQHGRDLDSWLALALTLVLFSDLHYVLAPPSLSRTEVLHSDVLRLLAYGVLLGGVWRAISQAEFGRAVADERARVAREIHDGLAQYLFALSTHVSMLESGAPLERALPRLRNAADAAQQEARFAVLALSSAGGSAPFDAALRRYVEFLTADGRLDVELDLDPAVKLAPDEQIEVFRIVQEGLANARRHAGARRAEVSLTQRGGRRIVTIRDDGDGFDGAQTPAGQGLRNMRLRAESIEGAYSLRSRPGTGTAIEVVLRPA